MPAITRIAVFRDPANPYSILAMQQRRAAAQLGVSLVEIGVHLAADVDPAFARMDGERINALCVHAYVPILAARDRIVALAAKQRVAAVYPQARRRPGRQDSRRRQPGGPAARAILPGRKSRGRKLPSRRS